jgi:hypothetical protein
LSSPHEIVNKYKGLNKIIKSGQYKNNEYIHFIDFLNYLFHRTINKTPSAWYVYDGDLIVRHNISFSDFFQEFKDIRYNRQYKIRYNDLDEYKSTITGSDTKVERYENVLIHRVNIKMHRYYTFEIEYNFLIVISEMDVVKPIKLQVYD